MSAFKRDVAWPQRTQVGQWMSKVCLPTTTNQVLAPTEDVANGQVVPSIPDDQVMTALVQPRH